MTAQHENVSSAVGTAGSVPSRGAATAFRRARRGVLGVAELAGLGVAALLFVLAVFGYAYFYVPAGQRLDRNQKELLSLQKNMREAEAEAKRQGEASASRSEISESLKNFEERKLAQKSEGKLALYGRLNDLIKKNNVRNTSGPSYTALESVADPARANRPEARAGENRLRSAYPGIAVGLTVEGDYRSLRAFIRDLELSDQFIIIDAVELESAKEPGLQGADVTLPLPAQQRQSNLISLRLEMVIYFRREGDASQSQRTAG